jgi:DNA-binding CsgD family transcriptional regulator
MELEIGDWKAINEALKTLYRELDLEKQLRVILEALNQLVPADSLAVNIANIHPPHQASFVSVPVDNAGPEHLALISQYIHESPFAAYYLATLDGNWKMTTDFMPLEDFYKTNLYRLGLGPVGVNQQIFSVLGVLGDNVYSVVLNRTHRCFAERERARLNTIQPHLVTSFFNAAAHSRAANSISQLRAAMESAPGAYGYFHGDGQVAWLQERAESWLLEFFAGEPFGDRNVPVTILEVVRHSAQEQNAPQTLARENPAERLLICLGASPVGGWILHLERKPKALPPYFRPLPQLSERKNEVLKWMVEGKRNAEIAAILKLSARTVEKHVHGILRELMVENRATAIVRAMEYCAAINHGMVPMPCVPPLKH